MRGLSIADWKALPRAGAVLAAATALFVSATVARADGEAGVVIQHGDGTIETYCVPLEGSSISGDQLLRRAGVAVEQFSGLVCAIGTNRDEGCFGASSFDSCTCKCSGASCTYWAFFAQQYGKTWVYSSRGFQAQEAKDGDLQGWRWGKGGPSSAPPPATMTFEQVCGHAPRGGAAKPATTAPAAGTTGNPPPAGSTTTLPPEGTATSPETGSSAVTEAAGVAPTVTVTFRAASPAADQATAQQRNENRSTGGLVAFGAVAAALVVAIAAAVVWRQRHGS